MNRAEIHHSCRPDSRLIRIILPVIMLMIIFRNRLQGQNNTLYLMHGIPQANQLNPAIRHKCRIYLALPVISSVRLNARNTSFGFHDVIHTGTGVQSDSYYLDVENLQDKMKRMNYLLLNTDVDLLGLVFSVRDWYFTLGIANNISMNLSYHDDIVSLKDGNWDFSRGETLAVKLDSIGGKAKA